MDEFGNLDQRISLLKPILGFQGATFQQLKEIADRSFVKHYAKREIIFSPFDKCEFFGVVIQGLVKIFRHSASGKRITYLLVEAGEPLDLVGLFTTNPRHLSAESIIDTCILEIKRTDFLTYTHKHPLVINNIMVRLEQSIDSANDKILDMIEKRVEQRLLKVLYTLQKKFGLRLKFTSSDFAELAGTTTESTLRALAQFRKQGIIKSGRGEVIIINPELIESQGSRTYWV